MSEVETRVQFSPPPLENKMKYGLIIKYNPAYQGRDFYYQENHLGLWTEEVTSKNFIPGVDLAKVIKTINKSGVDSSWLEVQIWTVELKQLG